MVNGTTVLEPACCILYHKYHMSLEYVQMFHMQIIITKCISVKTALFCSDSEGEIPLFHWENLKKLSKIMDAGQSVTPSNSVLSVIINARPRGGLTGSKGQLMRIMCAIQAV